MDPNKKAGLFFIRLYQNFFYTLLYDSAAFKDFRTNLLTLNKRLAKDASVVQTVVQSTTAQQLKSLAPHLKADWAPPLENFLLDNCPTLLLLCAKKSSAWLPLTKQWCAYKIGVALEEASDDTYLTTDALQTLFTEQFLKNLPQHADKETLITQLFSLLSPKQSSSKSLMKIHLNDLTQLINQYAGFRNQSLQTISVLKNPCLEKALVLFFEDNIMKALLKKTEQSPQVLLRALYFLTKMSRYLQRHLGESFRAIWHSDGAEPSIQLKQFISSLLTPNTAHLATLALLKAHASSLTSDSSRTETQSLPFFEKLMRTVKEDKITLACLEKHNNFEFLKYHSLPQTELAFIQALIKFSKFHAAELTPPAATALKKTHGTERSTLLPLTTSLKATEEPNTRPVVETSSKTSRRTSVFALPSFTKRLKPKFGRMQLHAENKRQRSTSTKQDSNIFSKRTFPTPSFPLNIPRTRTIESSEARSPNTPITPSSPSALPGNIQTAYQTLAFSLAKTTLLGSLPKLHSSPVLSSQQENSFKHLFDQWTLSIINTYHIKKASQVHTTVSTAIENFILRSNPSVDERCTGLLKLYHGILKQVIESPLLTPTKASTFRSQTTNRWITTLRYLQSTAMALKKSGDPISWEDILRSLSKTLTDNVGQDEKEQYSACTRTHQAIIELVQLLQSFSTGEQALDSASPEYH